MPADDLEALLTGMSASSPGCLCTYKNEVVSGKQVAQIATTIARPDRGYSGTYNYFDPGGFPPPCLDVSCVFWRSSNFSSPPDRGCFGYAQTTSSP
jgi:hypothetical protein